MVTLAYQEQKITGGVNKLFEYIQLNSGRKTADYKAAFDVPQRTVERWIKQLKDENRIEFRGAPKTCGYFVVEKLK